MSLSTSPNTLSTPSVSATLSPCPRVGRERCRFTPEDEVALFREVLSHEYSFERGRLIWNSVATNLSSGGKKFSTCLCRDRCQALVIDFIKADNKEKMDYFIFFWNWYLRNSYFEYISVPLLIVHRTGVEKQYSERNHYRTEGCLSVIS